MTETFAADLIAHSVWEVYEPGMAELAMVHGAEDAVASPEAAPAVLHGRRRSGAGQSSLARDTPWQGPVCRSRS